MRAAFERGQDVWLRAIRFGVFHEDVAGIGKRLRGRRVDRTGETRLAEYLSQVSARVLPRDSANEGEVRSPRNRARKLGPCPARGTRQTYFDHHRRCSAMLRGGSKVVSAFS